MPHTLTAESLEEGPRHEQPHKLGPLILGCLGVVYGDIGTSPLYALRESLRAFSYGPTSMVSDLLGVLSLIIWSLLLLVTLKYVFFLLRADNHGEGGILSLMALGQRAIGRRSFPIIFLGALGAALFAGDALITPAISVLSAVEGLQVAMPYMGHGTIVLLALFVLTLLFFLQSRGTHQVAVLFGPIMAAWFVLLGCLGVYHIINNPVVLLAFSPSYAVQFVVTHGHISFLVLGSVFLAVTGAEALYADLGHFGRRPIQAAWIWMVLPALALNYLGQGALILGNPTTLDNPFFRMVPEWGLIPMIALATAATVIASQAVITGAFSICQQAVQLGLLPRLEIRHTSAEHMGQIYMPQINTLLFIGVLLLVLMFGNSSNLASAYGVSVSGELLLTSIIAFIVIWRGWQWKRGAALALVAPFVLIEGVFLASNLHKIAEGGWVTLLIAFASLTVILTWLKGSRLLYDKARKSEIPLSDLIEQLERNPPPRVPGTAVFLTSSPETAPSALIQNLSHNKVLHDKNIVLTIVTADVPRVPERERVLIQQVAESFLRLIMTFGYMEKPSVLRGLITCRKLGWPFDLVGTSFFLSRRSVHAASHSVLPRWQDKLFILLSRNARPATDFFEIPADRSVEIGTRINV